MLQAALDLLKATVKQNDMYSEKTAEPKPESILTCYQLLLPESEFRLTYSFEPTLDLHSFTKAFLSLASSICSHPGNVAHLRT